jgi:SAM-dependent methyltransferase
MSTSTGFTRTYRWIKSHGIVRHRRMRLSSLYRGGKVRPCRTIDLGCGAGNYAIYLPGLGFEVTGVDSSPTAIKIAGENAKKQGVRCRFIVADRLHPLGYGCRAHPCMAAPEIRGVWVGVFFHGFWNFFIQQFYPLLAEKTPGGDMMLGEFGWFVAIVYVVLALVFWHFRDQLPVPQVV